VSERSIVAEYYNTIDSCRDGPEEQGNSDGKDNNNRDFDPREKSPEATNGVELGQEGQQNGEDPHKGQEAIEVQKSEDDPELNVDSADQEGSIGSIIGPTTGQVDSVEDYVNRVLGPRKPFGAAYVKELLGRTFPIWGCILLLIITRIPQIQIKKYLTLREPYFEIYFNTYGTFRLSASLVFQLNDILTYPNLNWKYELLYVPFIIPFVLVSATTMAIYRKDMVDVKPMEVVSIVAHRLVNPFIALLGALALVQLLIRVDSEAPAYILGTVLSQWFRQGFVVISPLLGALGSFFSGSTTVSNLTFGSVQAIAAESIGISKTSMLALQAVGGSAGNGICLNNIISACTIVGLNIGEGKILGQTYRYVFSNTSIATIVMLAFFIRFR
jgi:hypothetical protein